MESRESKRVRFGDFDLDLTAGELYRRGQSDGTQKVLLREQPFQILRMLIDRPGQVVTRDDIKLKLWPDDTIVDFDHSINVAIASLRREMGDGANRARYIETVARRGYRLITTVERLGATDADNGDGFAAPTGHSAAASVGNQIQSSPESMPDIERAGPKGGRLPGFPKLRTVAVISLVIAAGLWGLTRLGSGITLSSTDTIVLADINNRTSDPVFDDALNTAFRTALGQTPYLDVLEADKVAMTLSQLDLPPDSRLTSELARQIGLRTNSRAVVAGSISDAGNRFRLELEAIDCLSGKPISKVAEYARDRAEIVRVAGTCASELRASLGEPRDSIARFNRQLDKATSASPEALQQLKQGYNLHLSGDLDGASVKYRRAIELDPDFAMAYDALGAAIEQKHRAEAPAAYRKAYDLRERMTDPARLNAEYLYYRMVTGEQDKAYSTLLELTRTYPRDFIAHSNLARCLADLGKQDQAAEEVRLCARLIPSPWSYNAALFYNTVTDHFAEAKAIIEEADARKFDSPNLRWNRALLAFLQDDQDAMQDQWNWAAGKPEAGAFIWLKAHVEYYYGHFRAARSLMRQAIELLGKPDVPPRDRVYQALQEAEAGNPSESLRMAAADLPGAPAAGRRDSWALALARAGDIERAKQLADSVDRDFPLDTLEQNYCLPAIRAAIKLREHDAAAAIQILQPALNYDLSLAEPFNSLYPAYLRGLAYLDLGDGRQAAVEFQKLLDHRGIVGMFIIGALSHLQMARAERLMGDRAAAQKSYNEFFTLWKDADSDIPIYHEARKEYAEFVKGRPYQGTQERRWVSADHAPTLVTSPGSLVLNNTPAHGYCDGLSPIGGLEFFKDMLQMNFYGGFGNG